MGAGMRSVPHHNHSLNVLFFQDIERPALDRLMREFRTGR